MADKTDKKGCDCECCNGMMHGHGTGHWFVVLRLLIAVIVVIVAFGIGLKLGELRAAYYGVGYDGGYGNYRMMGGYPMMGGYYGVSNIIPPTTQSAPTTPAK